MKLRTAVCACVLLAMVVVAGSVSGPKDKAEVALLNENNWEEFIPGGKEVDAIYGDVVLRNKHLTAVIARPLASRHANMTVRDVAGALIDLTVRDRQSDQLSAFYPGRRRYPFRSWNLVMDEQTPVELNGINTLSGEKARVILKSEAAENRPAVELVYELGTDDRFLTVTTRYTNTGGKPLKVDLEDDIRADGGKEDMVKSPNGVDDLYWIHDRYWGQAYGVQAVGRNIRFNSDSRNSVLRYQDRSESESVTLQPGKTYELTRRIIPGADLVAVKAVDEETSGRKTYSVQVAARNGSGEPLAGARVEVSRGEQVWGSSSLDGKGLAALPLPAGNYHLKFSEFGVDVGRIPLTVTDSQVQEFKVEFGQYRPGRVSAEITDADDKPIPCKVEFRPKGDTPEPNFGPESAEFTVGNLYYAPHGKLTQALPAGRYDVIVSRGPEYDAIFTELAVPPGKTVELKGKLVRSVQTPGWISSDFHSHSSPSGDNTGSQLGRVLNLVCEHLEFAPCTEHNRISTYEPHIKRLKIQPWISTVSGMELTGRPLPLNHQNVFPLKRKPRTQDGGGPLTDTDPERQIERAFLWDERSDKLIQQNHPDVGWLFYDRNGDGKPDSGYERSLPLIDVMEIHPVENVLHLEPFESLRNRKGNNRVFNWLQLLNQGFRIPGVVNTDAHYNFHGSGWLRNWIQSSTDDPAKIKPMDVVHAAEQGRLIMSNGPYLEVTLHESGKTKKVTAGEDLEARSGNLILDVRVQCSNWLDIDRVFVLVNGKLHETHNYSRKQNPDKFRSGVVKFERQLELNLKSDAHVVVAAGGENSELGPVMGPTWGKVQPAAIANPIFVDVDGNGFQPNRDTLGHPLPVKFVSR